jgi:hypothetical protein
VSGGATDVEAPRRTSPPRRGPSLAGLAADAAIALAIGSLVFVPDVSILAGRVFANEIFFHWDHFAMGPALAWRHGAALATDVYAQYGTGLPVLLNAISPWVPLGHQNAIGLAMLHGCLHHVGVYALLRVAVEGRALAAGGTLAILATSIFSPLVAEQAERATIWQWPSLSVLRSPVDVWIFLVLFLHARRPTPTRAVAAGALAGLALWLETDTGIFLVGTLAVYGACRVVAAERGGSLPRATTPAGLTVAAALAAGGLVLLAGLFAASRGTVVSEPGAFLSGWIGGVANSSARGVGASAFAFFLRDHPGAFLAALAILGAAQFAVCDTGVRLLQGRATPNSVLAGCLGLYALGRLTLFVWRTVPIRLTLAAIPIGVLVVLALAAWRRRLPPRVAPLVPAGLLLASLALLATSPSLGHYPNLGWLAARGGAPPGLALFPERGEITGLPPRMAPAVAAIRAVIDEVRALDEPVAVLDPIKTLVYLEADEPPWRGDASTFLNTWTVEDQAALVAELERAGPPHVILRSVPSSPAVEDTWRVLARAVERHYVPARKLGVFQRWDRKPF